MRKSHNIDVHRETVGDVVRETISAQSIPGVGIEKESTASSNANVPTKKRFLVLDIGPTGVITRDQAIMILKTLKSKDYLPTEYCASLHKELTDLDEKRSELGEEAFHQRLTDAIRNTLDFVNQSNVDEKPQ